MVRSFAIARGEHQMILVHRHGAEAALKQMPRLARPGAEIAGIEPMRAAHHQSEAHVVPRRQNEMRVVGHQAIGPNRNAEPGARLRQPIAVERAIVVAEKHALAAIAALRDVT